MINTNENGKEQKTFNFKSMQVSFFGYQLEISTHNPNNSEGVFHVSYHILTNIF